MYTAIEATLVQQAGPVELAGRLVGFVIMAGVVLVIVVITSAVKSSNRTYRPGQYPMPPGWTYGAGPPGPYHPYGPGPRHPHGPAPQQPYGPAPQQPYGPAPQHPYGPAQHGQPAAPVQQPPPSPPPTA